MRSVGRSLKAVILFLAVCSVAVPLYAAQYGLTDLGANAVPRCINNNGWVAMDGAIRTRGGAVIPLAAASGSKAVPTAINGIGYVAGYLDPGGSWPGAIWNSSGQKVRQTGVQVTGLNNSGFFTLGSGLYDANGTQLFESYAGALSINNLGQAVFNVSEFIPQHGWNYYTKLWSGGVVSTIASGQSVLGYSLVPRIWGINDLGQYATSYRDYNQLRGTTIYYMNAGSASFGVSGDVDAASLNNKAQCLYRIGSSWYLWNGTSNVTVQSLLPAGWTLDATKTFSFNDNAEIVGVATYGGLSHGILLSSVPEPSSILVMLSGLGGFGGMLLRSRRR